MISDPFFIEIRDVSAKDMPIQREIMQKTVNASPASSFQSDCLGHRG